MLETQILKEQLKRMDQIIEDKSTDDNIDKIFNSIKEQIKIPAQIKKHYIKNDILFVDMFIDINQFYQWLSNNYPFNCVYIRKLWYKFLDYIKDIFDYGYHFNNIVNINKFIRYNQHPISLLDGIISDLPYNICSAAEIYKPIITDDKNEFNFIIIAKAFNNEEETDKDLVNNIYILNDNNEDKEENDNNEEEEIVIETKEEETKRLLEKYKNDGICHARIAHNVLKESQNKLDDITFIKSMELTPRIIKHSQNNNFISLLWSISKTQFINTFSIFRHNNNTEQVWQDFKNDFKINYNQYIGINKKFMSEYLISINQQLDHIVNDIVDVDISRENNVKFKSIIQIL